ncbi:hypothetical protein CPB86DRAFT_695685 [Serendipita vermifera]|nr:hypothetical protein CPB86DRAFT_695685 [Serendipita vermifera]
MATARPGPPPAGEKLDPYVCMQILAGAALNITNSRYLTVAGLTIAMYDIFLLFSDEIRLVWTHRSKRSIKILYFFNHYVPPIFLIIANYQIAPFRSALSTNIFSCRLWIPFALCFQVISGICSSYIILLRVIALYGDHRTVNLVTYTLFYVSYGVCISAAVICIVSMREHMGYYIDLGGICNYTGNQIWFIVVMVSPILFELTAGILTICKAFKHAYALWSSASSPLLHSLLRDGIFFCMIIVALRVCNVFIWTMLPSGSAYLGLYILWAPLSVMSTRFYLNVKDVATVDPFSPSYSTTMGQIRRRALESKKSATFARVSHSHPAERSFSIAIRTDTQVDTWTDEYQMTTTHV